MQDNRPKVISMLYRVSHKTYLTLTFYFEAVATTMLAMLGLPVFPDLYNSFDTLLIYFYDLLNKWQ